MFLVQNPPFLYLAQRFERLGADFGALRNMTCIQAWGSSSLNWRKKCQKPEHQLLELSLFGQRWCWYHFRLRPPQRRRRGPRPPPSVWCAAGSLCHCRRRGHTEHWCRFDIDLWTPCRDCSKKTVFNEHIWYYVNMYVQTYVHIGKLCTYMYVGMSPTWSAQNFLFSSEKIGLGHSCGHPYFETSPCMYIMGMEYNKQILFDMCASKNVAQTSSFDITIAKAPTALRKHSPYSKGPK